MIRATAVGLAEIGRDVTEWKRTEDHLREASRRKDESISAPTHADSMPQIIWSARPNGHCRLLQPSLCELVGTQSPSSADAGDGTRRYIQRTVSRHATCG